MNRPTPTTKFPLVNELRALLAEDPPFCSGTFELPPQAFELYYGKENARYVDFTKSESSAQALSELADACERAKFGRGTETVLDETYRKAWKMDPENFKTGLDVDECGLLDVVQTGLLPKYQFRNFRAELYKLNVYGEGAFFKPHQDTPRGEDMFGSLVVVMPTPHEGGELVLRHKGEEWTFDAAKLLSERGSNSLAYIAFFSDVEHEVLPVTSGHRVTLTYNLFYTWDRCTRLHREGVSAVVPAHADVSKLERLLSSLLDDPEFLPNGGTLGFALRHTYPFPNLWQNGMEDPLESLERWLKGSDHSLYEACEELGLKPLLRLIHDGDEYTVLLEEMVELPDDDDDGYRADSVMVREYGGVVVKPLDLAKPEDDSDGRSTRYKTLKIFWVTDWGRSDGVRSVRLAYGNEASIDHVYANVCLIVEIGPAGDRFPPESDEDEDGEDGEEEEGAEDEEIDGDEEEGGMQGEADATVLQLTDERARLRVTETAAPNTAVGGVEEENGDAAARGVRADCDDGASKGAK